MTARRLAWLLWALAAISYAVLVFWAGAKLIDAAGGALPFDLRPFGLGLEAAQAYLERLGPDGRAIYGRYVLPSDTVFPVLLGLALAYTSRLQFGRIGLGVFLALCYVLADIWENSVILGIMQAPALLDDAALGWLRLLTQAKFLFLALALGLIALRAWHRRRLAR